MAANENLPPVRPSSSLSHLMNPPVQHVPTSKCVQPLLPRQPLSSTPINITTPSRKLSHFAASKSFVPQQQSDYLGQAPTKSSSPSCAPTRSNNLGHKVTYTLHRDLVSPVGGPRPSGNGLQRYHSDPFQPNFESNSHTTAGFTPLVDQSPSIRRLHNSANISPSPHCPSSNSYHTGHHSFQANRQASSNNPLTPMSRGKAKASSSASRPTTLTRTNSAKSLQQSRTPPSISPVPSVLQSKTKRERDWEETDTSQIRIPVSGSKSICLNGLMRPEIFRGNNNYPTAFMDGEPEPPRAKNDKNKKKTESPNNPSILRSGGGKSGAPSLNAWDYLVPPGTAEGDEKEEGENQDGANDTDEDDDHDENDDNDEDVSASGKKRGQPAKKMKNGRRKFDDYELWAVHVLWHVRQNPSKTERQRLGNWIGSPTRHIAVWFQNRRQEYKREIAACKRAEQTEVSMANSDGTESYNHPTPGSSMTRQSTPLSNKKQNLPENSYRNFPIPTDKQCDTVKAIIVGELTRDHYFSVYPLDSASTDQHRSQRPRLYPSVSMDAFMEGRDVDRGDRPRRPQQSTLGSDVGNSGANLWQMMSSDGPEPDGPVSYEDDEDDMEATDTDTLRSDDHSQVSASTEISRQLGRGHPSTSHQNGARATSLNILVSNPRAREIHAYTSRSSSGPPTGNSTANRTPLPVLKTAAPSTYNKVFGSKMDLVSHRILAQQPHRDSFQRSQSFAINDSDNEVSTESTVLAPEQTPPNREKVYHDRPAPDSSPEEPQFAKGSLPVDSADSTTADSKVNEPDEEMLEAAQQLFSISGRSSSVHTSSSSQGSPENAL